MFFDIECMRAISVLYYLYIILIDPIFGSYIFRIFPERPKSRRNWSYIRSIYQKIKTFAQWSHMYVHFPNFRYPTSERVVVGIFSIWLLWLLLLILSLQFLLLTSLLLNTNILTIIIITYYIYSYLLYCVETVAISKPPKPMLAIYTSRILCIFVICMFSLTWCFNTMKQKKETIYIPMKNLIK